MWFSARNDRISESDPLQIVAIFWLIVKLWAYKLWLAWRLYPVLPPVEVLNFVPAWIHALLYAASCIALVAVIIHPDNKRYIKLLLVIEILCCLPDETRWQPWQYQYMMVTAASAFCKSPRQMLIVILSGVYFYSGLHKLNPQFIERIWSKWILAGSDQVRLLTGYGAAILECSAAAGLLFVKTRRISARILFCMHLFILIIIGPFGKNYNTIVWPWNLCMMMLLQSFIANDKNEISSASLKSSFAIVLTSLVFVMPALNFIRLWPTYLSFSLYSGKTPVVYLCVNDSTKMGDIDLYLGKRDKYNFCKGRPIVSLSKWSLSEIKVPYYPEEKSLNKLEKILNQKYPEVGFSMGYFYDLDELTDR
jgi:hypothetical protein